MSESATNKEATPEETPNADVLQTRYKALESRFKKIVEQIPVLEGEGAMGVRETTAFRDMMSQLMSVLPGKLEFAREDPLPPGIELAKLQGQLAVAEEYLKAVESNSEFRKGELQKKGSAPEIYEACQQETMKAVSYMRTILLRTERDRLQKELAELKPRLLECLRQRAAMHENRE